ATITSGDYASLMIAFSSAFISIFAVKTIEKRFDFLKTGIIIGLVNACIVISIALMRELALQQIIASVRIAVAAGVINTIVVMGVFPILENMFSLTTKFKLFELSDLNAPIFKEMLIKAPGTYNHSILVANMAEAACKSINANSILARVGSYYHDIGKLENPQIFIENKNEQAYINLSPAEYSSKIIRHVNKGVVMARQMRLPHDVIRFIQEHHGDSKVTYFYHKALENAQKRKDKNGVNQEDYTYPGPKPQSRETAVVMLADAVEAASRSVTQPTEEKLSQMINSIIYDRLNQGHLEHSNLTMTDLNRIKASFLTLLTGIFHTRMEYPDTSEIQTLEKKVQGRKK
ncbi:MAG: HDIG domain-containing metalloprotein, partial [Spirochaetota bacterium]